MAHTLGGFPAPPCSCFLPIASVSSRTPLIVFRGRETGARLRRLSAIHPVAVPCTTEWNGNHPLGLSELYPSTYDIHLYGLCVSATNSSRAVFCGYSGGASARHPARSCFDRRDAGAGPLS